MHRAVIVSIVREEFRKHSWDTFVDHLSERVLTRGLGA